MASPLVILGWEAVVCVQKGLGWVNKHTNMGKTPSAGMQIRGFCLQQDFSTGKELEDMGLLVFQRAEREGLIDVILSDEIGWKCVAVVCFVPWNALCFALCFLFLRPPVQSSTDCTHTHNNRGCTLFPSVRARRS